MFRQILRCSVIALCVATTLPAQQAAAPTTAPDSTLQAIAAMKSALRNLVVAQEKHWAAHGTYTTDLSALGLYPPPAGARPPMFYPQVIFAGGRGWSGIAVHRTLKKSCVIFVGSLRELPFVPKTQNEQLPASTEGAPTCESP